MMRKTHEALELHPFIRSMIISRSVCLGAARLCAYLRHQSCPAPCCPVLGSVDAQKVCDQNSLSSQKQDAGSPDRSESINCRISAWVAKLQASCRCKPQKLRDEPEGSNGNCGVHMSGGPSHQKKTRRKQWRECHPPSEVLRRDDAIECNKQHRLEEEGGCWISPEG